LYLGRLRHLQNGSTWVLYLAQELENVLPVGTVTLSLAISVFVENKVIWVKS
jgi:hypothetical protein